MFTSLITSFVNYVVLPSLLAEAAVAMPFFGWLLGVPVIGDAIRKTIQWFVDKMLDKGFISIKTNLIDILSDKAKVQYAPQIEILRAAQAQDTLTKEQEEEYAKKLYEVGRNRPGIVNG